MLKIFHQKQKYQPHVGIEKNLGLQNSAISVWTTAVGRLTDRHTAIPGALSLAWFKKKRTQFKTGQFGNSRE